jgi:hypothetical protein
LLQDLSDSFAANIAKLPELWRRSLIDGRIGAVVKAVGTLFLAIVNSLTHPGSA